MEYYFSKEYLNEPYKLFMNDIGKVDYYKCNKCGFVLSKTHSELPFELWNKLNSDYHHYTETEKHNRYRDSIFTNTGIQRKENPPPYLEQAEMLFILSKNGIIDSSDILDYAGGYGTLNKLLQKYFNMEIVVYDPYIYKDNTVYANIDITKKYKVVFNSAMFEHVTCREDLEKLNQLVADQGCLILHTVICEKIPNDAEWFYLGPPVHCAFHTNKSMELLMQQWGYTCSIYCPTSKCWILFKNESDIRYQKINLINQEIQKNYFYYKKGFVDYWKGF